MYSFINHNLIYHLKNGELKFGNVPKNVNPFSDLRGLKLEQIVSSFYKYPNLWAACCAAVF